MSQFSQGRLSQWPSRNPARAAEKNCRLFERVKLSVFECKVPTSPVGNVAERAVLHAGIVARVADNRGAIRWPGTPIGAHTEEVLREFLGLGGAELEALRREKVL